MTREDFWKKLEQYEVDPSLVNLDDSTAEEVFAMRREGNKWLTFWRERGQEHDIKSYWSERDALGALCQEIISRWGRPEHSPYDVRPSLWLSEQPDIRIEVAADQRFGLFNKNELKGTVVLAGQPCRVHFTLFHDGVMIMTEYASNPRYLRGTFCMQGDSMVVTVTKKTDSFYHGEYPTLVFKLQQ